MSASSNWRTAWPRLLSSAPLRSSKEVIGRGLELFSFDVLRDLIFHRLDAHQKVDQHIRISKDHRQLSRSSLAVFRNSSPSFLESDPPSDSKVLRRLSRSTSPCKKLFDRFTEYCGEPLLPAARCQCKQRTTVLRFHFYRCSHTCIIHAHACTRDYSLRVWIFTRHPRPRRYKRIDPATEPPKRLKEARTETK